MTDQARDKATARIRALLAARPDLRPTLEALYAKAWLETLTLLAALDVESADSATLPRQLKSPRRGEVA